MSDKYPKMHLVTKFELNFDTNVISHNIKVLFH